MKRFLMLAAVATIAGAMYVAAAPGSQQATGPTETQFVALKKRVALLSKTLTALKKDEAKVKTAAGTAAGFIADCFDKAGAAPVSQFGDPNGTFGFGYQAAPGTPGTITSYRTALDVDASAAPQGYLQGVDASCVSTTPAASPAASPFGSGLQVLRAEHAR
jgi:hypothetical protein